MAEQRRAFTVLATDVHGSMQRTLLLVSDASSAVRDTMASLHSEMSTWHDELRAGFLAVDAKFDQVDTALREI